MGKLIPFPDVPATATLHPDIAQGVCGLDAARRAEVTHCVSEVFQGARNWRGSALTGDGFPFELCFHTGKDTLYWTADPARGQGAQDQLAQITRTATRLGDPVTHPLVAELPGLRIPLYAGSWLGGRHDVGVPVSCKLYTDWTDSAACRALFPALSLPYRLPNGARHKVRGIGLGPGPDRTEIYYRFDYATPRHMHHVLDFAGLADQSAETIAAVENQTAAGLETVLESSGLIASLALDRAGGPVTVTFYFFARSFWGSDRHCRAAFLGLFTKAGRPIGPYAAASAPLQDRVRYDVFHGLVAFTVTAVGSAWGIGLRPVRADSGNFHAANSGGIYNG